MRHRRTFNILAWVGAGVLGLPVASATVASGYPEYQIWSQKKLSDWLPAIMSQPLWLVLITVTVIGYLAVMYYCATGTPPPPSEQEMEDLEFSRLRAYGRARVRYDEEVLKAPKNDSDVEIEMRDVYKNTGTVHGNMGPTTNIYGKPQFEMTDAVMEDARQKLGSPRPISMAWVGSEKSHQDGAKLAVFLTKNGFSINEISGIGVLAPPLSTPIELRGSTVYVDSDK